MGSTVSKPASIGLLGPSLLDMLTADQRADIARSWSTFYQISGDPGVKIFLNIFARCPSAKVPFLERYHRTETIPAGVSEQERTELVRLIRTSGHTQRFIHGVDQMISHLGERDGDQVSNDIITTLGARHCFIEDFNVGHMNAFAQAILETLQQELPHAAFSRETEENWNIFLGHTVYRMTMGYNVAREKLESADITLVQPRGGRRGGSRNGVK